TPRMEKALTKDQILALYVNEVNFGHGRYGIEEASLFYFGKHAKDLSLAEAAVIAGTVQSPERKNPVTSVTRAKSRRNWVLDQMWQKGFVPKPQAQAAQGQEIVLGPRPPERVGAYYAEDIRKILVARYGDHAVLEGGMKVDIAMNPKLQAAAEDAVREGLELVDRRQGYRGALFRLEPDRFAKMRPFLKT